MSEPRWQETDLPQPTEVSREATARTLRVPPELAGTRLDVFLRLSLRGTSRTRAKRIAKQAAFTILGDRMKPNRRLKAEEHVVLWRVAVDSIDETPELPIIYEDEHLLVLNKPPNVTVHPTASHYHNTVTKILEARYPGRYFRLVHRLDKETSGILLVALSPKADRAFKMLLEGTIEVPAGAQARVTKTYQAITWGVPAEGLIDRPMERDADNPLRVKMKASLQGRGQEARTEVEVEEEKAGYALVRCKLLTGRQHQIRLHLALTGTPVVGDKLYGPNERFHALGADGKLTEEDWATLEMRRQALHAFRYQLSHAITWEELDLRAPLPDDILEFWRSRGN